MFFAIAVFFVTPDRRLFQSIDLNYFSDTFRFKKYATNGEYAVFM